MTTVLDVLVRAQKLVKQGWCQFDFAQDAQGQGTSSIGSDAACKFCAWGAIRHATWELESDLARQIQLEVGATRALGMAIKGDTVCPGGTIAEWNDTFGRKQIDVLEVYDIAIEQEKNRASMA